MNTTNLDKIVAHKAGLSPDNETDAEIIAIARAETLADISRRWPWSFLERKDTDTTLAADDTETDLPDDFVRLICKPALYASDNQVYQIHPEQPGTHDEGNPDEDDTVQPYTYWLEWDSTSGDPKIVFGQKVDGAYTLRLRYQKTLSADQVAVLPHGLPAGYGMMVLLCNPDETATYKNLYEAAIAEMWASDIPDLNDMPDLKADRAIERFNQDMWNL